ISLQPSRYANPVSRSDTDTGCDVRATPDLPSATSVRLSLLGLLDLFGPPGFQVDRANTLPERIGAARRERPEPYVENVRHAEARNADRDQGDEHALGPLDQAHVTVQPEALRPGLRVRHQE